MSEKFNLKWNDFETNISKSFSKLRGESQLFDVTLVGQDQKRLSAHKVVLSACSDFFRNIFYSNTHSHPMLYLDGVDSTDIYLMLNYIYQGEVKIHQEHLDRFLDGANKFKLDGLMGSAVKSFGDMKTEHLNHHEEVEDLMQVKQPQITKAFTPKPHKERALRVIQDSSEMIDASNKDIKQLYQDLIFGKEGNFKCTVCEKTMGHKGSMERHVETHMTGLSYDCKHCGEKIRSREALKNHLRNNPSSSRWSTSCRSRKMLADHTFKI